MNVLSLFDGMSCGHQALDRAGIKVDKYFASEIDKYSIKVTMKNYPDTIQLGSVVDVKGSDLPKIYLLIGGSPCQSFSFAGKRKGMATKCNQEITKLDQYLKMKEDDFEFEGQSYLFWEYMRIKKEINPTYWLLENVRMEERWERIISKALQIKPVVINSSLVSAQNRHRLYWTNIGAEPQGLFGIIESTIEQPKDRGILLKDILESEIDEKYYLSDKAIERAIGNDRSRVTDINKKSGSILSNQAKQSTDMITICHNMQPRSPDRPSASKVGSGHLTRNDGKTYCLDAGQSNAVEIVANYRHHIEGFEGYTNKSPALKGSGGSGNNIDIEIVAMRGRGDNNEQTLEMNGTGRSNSLTSVAKDNLVAIMLGRSKEYGQPENGGGKSYTLCKNEPHGIKQNTRIRRLTPTECARLQTVADDYIRNDDGSFVVSDSQLYKMLGNGWTIEVIAHIFSYLIGKI